jgi:tetratricopeptide (TPR) repeat protein
MVSGWYANELGNSAEAISEGRKAIELEPLSVMYNFSLADMYFMAREYDQAIQQSNRVLEIDPASSDAIKMIGYSYEAMRNYPAAMQQWIKNAQVLGHPERGEELRRIFEKEGYRGYLRKDAEYYESQRDFYDAGGDYALLGEKDAAFAELEKAVDEGQEVDDMKLDPGFDSLRSDPRFARLLRRIGLPQ